MSDYTYTIVHDPLTRTQYTLRYFAERNTVRLVGYYEMHRDTPRKQKWIIDRWYDWHNQDRRDVRFKPISEITLPQAIKQQFMQELIESMTFIITEESIR